MKNNETNNNNNQNENNKPSNYRKNKKLNMDNSPDSEKFDKSVEELTKYIRDNSTNENELLKIFVFFTDVSKKTKYQLKIMKPQY